MADENFFSQYEKMTEALSFAQMRAIHQAILENAEAGEEDFAEVWAELVRAAIKYSGTRANWKLLSRAEKMATDGARTNAHNLVLDHFIVLERIFKRNGWDSASWTTPLFLVADTEVGARTRASLAPHRKRVGDFANYLAFVYALNGR